MIDSLTIFSRSGAVLYHHQSTFLLSTTTNAAAASNAPRSHGDGSDGEAPTTMSPRDVDRIKLFVSTVLSHSRLASVASGFDPPAGATKRRLVLNESSSSPSPSPSSSPSSVVAEWETSTSAGLWTSGNEGGGGTKVGAGDWIAVSFVPALVASSSSSSSSYPASTATSPTRRLLRLALREYALYYDSQHQRRQGRECSSRNDDDHDEEGREDLHLTDSEREMHPPDAAPFDSVFRALVRRIEKSSSSSTSTFDKTGADKRDKGNAYDEYYDEEQHDDDNDNDDDKEKEEVAERGTMDIAANIAKLKSNKSAIRSKKAGTRPKSAKERRVWHDGTAKVTKSALQELDRSKKKSKKKGSNDDTNDDQGVHDENSSNDDDDDDDDAQLAEARAAYLPTDGEVMGWDEEDVELIDEDDDDDDDDDNAERATTTKDKGWGSSIKSLLLQMSGNKLLTPSDLDGPLTEMHRLLTSKNVASDTAAEICRGVRDVLVGKKMNSFSTVKTAVRHALESSIERLLSPGVTGVGRGKGRDVDLLREALSKRERQSFKKGGALSSLFGSSTKGDNDATKSSPYPYVIVMVGINGVGKSTSLAKIAYYLKANGCHPLVAACDTFRSGAVEQLAVHAKCLDVPLFQRGYAKDPSAVAIAAIERARTDGRDVVLIDTAGRMQNNVPLMSALGKLVDSCRPDAVLFVCEALVGNDGLDQLRMFERALLRTGGTPGGGRGRSRAIDGIILTKFDTVSDKVGAALTLTHESGSPIVFIGTGQKYNHLKPLSVRAVIQSLFS